MISIAKYGQKADFGLLFYSVNYNNFTNPYSQKPVFSPSICENRQKTSP